MKKNKFAFTLIELLVVIAIIGVLATLAIVALQNSRANARDSKRLADIKQMQTALELYFNDNKLYPTSVTSTISTGSTVYMDIVPSAPTPVDGDCTAENNTYAYTSDGSTYSILFCLGSRVGGTDAGQKEASASGVSNYVVPPAPWACGEVLTDSRDSQQYPTVLIGTQCWMAKNLAYLPLVNDNSTFVSLGNSSQPAYGVYGYDGNNVTAAKALSDYTTYGVLYNWYATMNGSTVEESQGICPTGWHVPSSAEFTTLSAYLGGDSVSGGKLKQIGTFTWASPNTGATNESQFTALAAGSRLTSGYFNLKGSYGNFWSSSFSSPNVLVRRIPWNSVELWSYNATRLEGNSIRCLKN